MTKPEWDPALQVIPTLSGWPPYSASLALCTCFHCSREVLLMYRPSTHIYFSQLFLNTDWHGGGCWWAWPSSWACSLTGPHMKRDLILGSSALPSASWKSKSFNLGSSVKSNGTTEHVWELNGQSVYPQSLATPLVQPTGNAPEHRIQVDPQRA